MESSLSLDSKCSSKLPSLQLRHPYMLLNTREEVTQSSNAMEEPQVQYSIRVIGSISNDISTFKSDVSLTYIRSPPSMLPSMFSAMYLCRRSHGSRSVDGFRG